MKDETTSPDGLADNAVMEDFVLFADTLYGGRVIVEFDPFTDCYVGQVIRCDRSRFVFNIGCTRFSIDTDNESSMSNLLHAADVAIRASEKAPC